MPKFPARRNSNRILQHDYSTPGYYFVTICVENRHQIFGVVKNDTMILNDIGNMIDLWWQKIFEKYDNISIDEYIIMPNHIHGIINVVGAAPCSRPLINPIGPIQNNNNQKNINDDIVSGENIVSPLQYNGLGQYISWFKRMTTNKYIQNVKNNNWQPFNKRLWQRNYYDHIIRNDKSLNQIREYIRTNSATWNKDIENPNRIGNIEPQGIPV